MTPPNQPSQPVNPAQALLTMIMSNPPLTNLTDARVDAVVSDLLAEIAALDLQHNKGKTIRPDQLDEQLFGRSRTFRDDRAALPYLRYNLRAAHEEFASLVNELRNAGSGILTAATLIQFSAIFTDYLFDLREILVPLQKNTTGWTFFAGVKSFVNSSWEVFRLARSLSIQSAWSPTGIHLDHKASQIASILVLRQALELRFERCQRRSKNRPLWRSKSRPLMLRQVQSKGPRSGPFAFGRFDGSVFVDGGLVLLRPAGSGATATG